MTTDSGAPAHGGDRLPLILFATPTMDTGGPDRVLFELICGLPRDRFRIALAVQQGGGHYLGRLPTDVTTHLVGGGRYPIRQFARLVDVERPDLVFATLRMNMTSGIATLIQRHRPRLVARQANAIGVDFAALKRQSLLKHRIAERVVKYALTRADTVVAQSIDMADEIAPVLKPGQLLATIGNPIDIAATRRLAAEQAEGMANALPGVPALISVGRLMAQKGFDLLISAMPTILANHPKAVLTILGEGEDRAALTAQAAALGIADHVRMPGQSHAALAAVARADLFVSSSRYEGFSNAMLEAMALGIPVAATICPGAAREMIEDGVSGMLAPAARADAIADAVLRALAADRTALVREALAHTDRRYSRAAILAAYTAMLLETLAGP